MPLNPSKSMSPCSKDPASWASCPSGNLSDKHGELVAETSDPNSPVIGTAEYTDSNLNMAQIIAASIVFLKEDGSTPLFCANFEKKESSRSMAANRRSPAHEP